MAKTDTASNRKMSFFIRLGPFELLRAFRLEPKAKMTGRVAVRGLVPILERFWAAMSGETVLGRSMRAIGRTGETVKSQEEKERLEARGGIEPPIMVLQTIALPLGYRATGGKSYQSLVAGF